MVNVVVMLLRLLKMLMIRVRCRVLIRVTTMGNYVTRFACAFQIKRAMIVVMMVMMIFGAVCSRSGGGSSDEAT